MRVIVNGQEMDLPQGATLPDVLERMAVSDARGVAVAVDDEVIPTSSWAETGLRDGQRVEILRAVQGG